MGTHSIYIDYIALGLSVLSIVWTSVWTIILYKVRPKLEIEINKGIEKQNVYIKVINERNCSDAINLNMEVCTVRNIDKTKHLKIEKEDFLILPSKDNREFKAKCLPEIEERLKETGTVLRVRVYATHSFTGFGEAFEAKFKYDAKLNTFIKK